MAKASKVMQNPAPEHWTQLHKVLKYLKGTADWGLYYHGPGCGNMTFTSFSDASYNPSDDDLPRCTTGEVHVLNGAAVDYSSATMKSTATSSLECEYAAMCTNAKSAFHCRGIINDLGVLPDGPSPPWSTTPAPSTSHAPRAQPQDSAPSSAVALHSGACRGGDSHHPTCPYQGQLGRFIHQAPRTAGVRAPPWPVHEQDPSYFHLGQGPSIQDLGGEGTLIREGLQDQIRVFPPPGTGYQLPARRGGRTQSTGVRGPAVNTRQSNRYSPALARLFT
eukprot:CAMPEP_0182854564 /NCGR_PEP_ID=MMETSP0034_2-20130328/1326_1 /TAXON_ID=156128 /ORGANISM="Nephroselmis pyriformis, Strain CCMP717" /LENGTH=276 /DNA_ID=CAMNT_0024985415 /DNA_START=147 /DNA_END=977 /DNA_ORIENTATION=+